jgi:hypothetical protein
MTPEDAIKTATGEPSNNRAIEIVDRLCALGFAVVPIEPPATSKIAGGRVRAWISDNPDKRRSIPAGVCRDLLVMLRQKSAQAKALADEIDAARHG